MSQKNITQYSLMTTKHRQYLQHRFLHTTGDEQTFSIVQPETLQMIKWIEEGNEVFCEDCWWIGPDNNYDICPDCNSFRLAFLIDLINEFL